MEIREKKPEPALEESEDEEDLRCFLRGGIGGKMKGQCSNYDFGVRG